MNAPHETLTSATRLSRRAESLGTENAFVVLAEVNALIREGKEIVSFCIGQPDFPTPTNIQKAAIDAIKLGKHGYTPSAGIDELRAAAAKDMGARRGIDFRPDDVVVAAGAKPFIAYTIASVTDYGVGDDRHLRFGERIALDNHPAGELLESFLRLRHQGRGAREAQLDRFEVHLALARHRVIHDPH